MKFNRKFAMPNPETFKLAPVAELLSRYIPDKGQWGTITKDLNPDTAALFHLPEEFVTNDLFDNNGCADLT